MRTARTIADVRAGVAQARAGGATIGLVPTMGAFHDGHLALMRAARAECDHVVCSLFVNPAQFDEAADLAAYPRDEARDAALAAGTGVDTLFAPAPEAIYPPGFATTVTVGGGLTAALEGHARGPGHFAGVTTVVAKLLNAVGPDVAYFGAKDAQQVAVVRRMVADLDLPVRVAVVPTVREPDGLAMSSRNGRLDPEERARAVALSEALRAARDAARAGERDPDRLLAAARAPLAARAVEPEYLALVDPESFEAMDGPAERVTLVLAARIGQTRLIDNATLDLRPPAVTGSAGADQPKELP
jgi:pantoate--beta-alanine ligase